MTTRLNNINELQDMHKDENIVRRLTKFILQNDLKQSQIDEFITENKDELETITELSFKNGRDIETKGAIALAPILRYTNITYLDLSYNDIRDGGTIALANILEYTNITYLNLRSNHIENNGAIALANILEYTNITDLYLDSNDIADRGITALIDGVKNTYITYITDFSFCVTAIITTKPPKQLNKVIFNNSVSANTNFEKLILKNEYLCHDEENTKNLLSKYQYYGEPVLKPSKHTLAENGLSIEDKFTEIDESIKKYYLDILSECSRKCYMPTDLQSIVSGYCNDKLPRFDLSLEIEIIEESSEDGSGYSDWTNEWSNQW